MRLHWLLMALLTVPLMTAAAEVAAAPVPTAGAAAAPPAPAFDFKAYEEARAKARAKVDEAQNEYERAQVALLTAAGLAEGQLPATGKTWPPAELDAYLSASLMLVSAGLEYQTASNQTLPFVLTPGSMQGWLKQWPGNPLNAWQPIRVLPEAGGYWPGDIAWVLSPPDKYGAANGRLQPGPYSLRIYGGKAPPKNGAATLGAVASVNSPTDSTPVGTLDAAQKSRAADDAWMRQRAHRVDKLATELKARPRQQWRSEQQTEYLQQALWLIYTGLNSASWSGVDSSAWTSSKPDMSLLPYWPGNPYASWAPMQIKAGSFGLKNGDIYLEQSPAYYAMLGSNGNLVNSYQMYVLGPGAQPATLLPPDPSSVWAGPPPPGAVGSLGISTTPLLSSEFNRAICHS
jgi:hypothetical protein